MNGPRAPLAAGDLPEAVWVKSSYSAGEGNCVEVADLRQTRACVAVRDSKAPHGPTLQFTPEAFAQLIQDALDRDDVA